MSIPAPIDPTPWAFVKHHLKSATSLPWADMSQVKCARPAVYLVHIKNAAKSTQSGTIMNYGSMKIMGPAPADTPKQKEKILALHQGVAFALAPLLDSPKNEAILIIEVHFSTAHCGFSTVIGIPRKAPVTPAADQLGV